MGQFSESDFFGNAKTFYFAEAFILWSCFRIYNKHFFKSIKSKNIINMFLKVKVNT